MDELRVIKRWIVMKYIIFFEHAERELQNAYLLKSELVRREHEVYIFNIDYLHKTKQVLNWIPDVIIVPSLYYNVNYEYFTSVFSHKIAHIVNLQYEQILSKEWKRIGFHNPRGLAKNAIHLCWGEESQRRIVEHGVKKENAIIVGSINLDMDHNKFRNIYKSKEEISCKYNLDINKNWILFISNFTFNNKKRERLFKIRFGEESASKYINTCKKTKKIILEWVEKFINENDCEFIYRPHPSETPDKKLIDLKNKYENFHIIKEDCVRSWINVSDKINIWNSTCISDIYFMNKDCIILRPLDNLDGFESDIYLNSIKSKTYEEFRIYNTNLNLEKKFPVDEKQILKFYHINKNKFAYERICYVLETLDFKNIGLSKK